MSGSGFPALTVSPLTPGAKILGVGAYRPERVVMNAELVERIDSSDEWIRERSGIVSRHWARADESVIDMGLTAAKGALEYAGLQPTDIDAVLMATVTHLNQTPSAAALLAHRLGADSPMAMDLSAACAGYCHGVAVAHDLVRCGSAKNVLVIGVEKLSDFTDLDDRTTAFLFGDGAGAVVIGQSDTPAIGPTVWGSDGSKWDLINQKSSWDNVTDTRTGWPYLTMQGQSVFRWAVWGMAPVALKALAAAGIGVEDLDVFLPHQANSRIIDAMAKQMKIPDHVAIARDITTTGNTSSASIPLAMHRMLTEGTAKSGDVALQIGFGAGLVYAAQVVVLP